MILQKKTAIEKLGLPYNDKIVLENKIIENQGWSTLFELIFTYKGKVWQTFYTIGSTDNCDEEPWEFEDTIECKEVVQVEKIVKVWELKK